MKRVLFWCSAILVATMLFVLHNCTASAQQIFYDASGKIVGRASTDSQGSTTFYDAGGKVTGRSAKSGETTTLYDAAGRNIGRVTKQTR
jgi:YD repeat-containing protein